MITPQEFQEVRLPTEEIHWEHKHLDPPEEIREAQKKPIPLIVYGQMNPKNWCFFYEGY